MTSPKGKILQALEMLQDDRISSDAAFRMIHDVLHEDDVSLSELGHIVHHISQHGHRNPSHEEFDDDYGTWAPQRKKRRALKYGLGIAAVAGGAPAGYNLVKNAVTSAPDVAMSAGKSLMHTIADPATHHILATHAKHAAGYYAHGIGYSTGAIGSLVNKTSSLAHDLGTHLLSS